MNTDLLKRLYGVFSPSRNTKKMRLLLKKEVALRGGVCVQDKAGNLFVTNGVAKEYPCLASHYDQVSCHTHPKDFRCIESGDIIMGWSDKLARQCGLGADDKNGIFICLNALERFDVLKVAFFVDEEIGCIGSSHTDLGFFNDVRFVIEPDRMNGSDFISSMSGVQVCSDEFIKDSDFAEYGYKHEMGSVTDVLTLLESGIEVSCLNLSCGYYHPHTDQEVTRVSELENCQNLVFHMVEKMQRKYPFEYAAPLVGYRGLDYFADDSDCDMMDDILTWNPDLGFEEVLDIYGTNFASRDEGHLRQIYEDTKYMLGIDDTRMEMDDFLRS